jgi:hypothetical protein
MRADVISGNLKKQSLLKILNSAVFAVFILFSLNALCNNTVKTAIMLNINPDSENLNRLKQALKGELASVDTTLKIVKVEHWPEDFKNRIALAENIAAKYPAVAVFWCELQDDKIYLYLSASTGDRLLVRRLDAEKAGDLNEVAAVIVRSSIVAIEQGGEIGIDVKTAKKIIVYNKSNRNKNINGKSTKKAAEKNSPGHLQELYHFMELRTAYVFTSYSKEFPANHGFGFSLGVQFLKNWFVHVETRFLGPMEAQKAHFHVSVRQYPIGAGVKYQKEKGIWSFGGFAGAEVVIQNVKKVSLNEDSRADKDNIRAGFAIIAQLELAIRLHNLVRIFIAPGAQFMLWNINYTVIKGNGEEVPIIKTWPVRPLVMLGLDLSFF